MGDLHFSQGDGEITFCRAIEMGGFIDLGLDSHLSYQRACLHAIDYLTKFGYSDIQAYMILGSAPTEGRLSGVVDIPNSCSTVYIPTGDLRYRRAPLGCRAGRSLAARMCRRPVSDAPSGVGAH
jgi:formamidase